MYENVWKQRRGQNKLSNAKKKLEGEPRKDDFGNFTVTSDLL
jgi:hypothetical protein